MREQLNKKKYIDIFFLYCDIRNGGFGMNSHANSLINFFKKIDNYNLTIIKTDSKDTTEFDVIFDNNVKYLKIPSPESNFMHNTTLNHIQSKYAERTVDLIIPHIDSNSNNLFIVNSIDFLNIVLNIRERVENIKLINIHHSWSWKYFKNSSDQNFTNAWIDQNKEFSENALLFSKYQQNLALISDKTIALTKQAFKMFRTVFNIPEYKLTHIYNGIDETVVEVLEKSEKIKMKHQLGFNSNDKVIVFSGRLVKDKGIFFLINAFKQIVEKIPEARLVLIGNGEFNEIIKYAYPYFSKVYYTGSLSKNDIYNLYKIADLSIFPSLAEQCSYFSIECMFFKIPLLVTSVDGLEEMFDDYINCLKIPILYDHKNERYVSATNIADDAIKLLRDEELSLLLSNNAYLKGVEFFTEKKMLKSYQDLIEEIFPYSSIN